jgi:hypothetical protein
MLVDPSIILPAKTKTLIECGDSSADSGEIQPETRLFPKSRVSLITKCIYSLVITFSYTNTFAFNSIRGSTQTMGAKNWLGFNFFAR